MANFLIAEAITGAAEGGYADDPVDKGGETYCGIARNHWPDWVGWTYIDSCRKYSDFPKNLDHKGLEPFVEKFYIKNFWQKIMGDDMPNQHQANLLYDVAVNMGVGYSAKCLQRALNTMNRQAKDYPDISEDGAIGNQTLSSIKSLYRLRKLKGELSLMFGFYCQVGAHWKDIAVKNKTQERFINGWYWRGVNNIKHIAKDYLN